MAFSRGAATASPPSVEPTFSCFSELPVEIRCKLWRDTFPSSRLILINGYNADTPGLVGEIPQSTQILQSSSTLHHQLPSRSVKRVGLRHCVDTAFWTEYSMAGQWKSGIDLRLGALYRPAARYTLDRIDDR